MGGGVEQARQATLPQHGVQHLRPGDEVRATIAESSQSLDQSAPFDSIPGSGDQQGIALMLPVGLTAGTGRLPARDVASLVGSKKTARRGKIQTTAGNDDGGLCG